MEHDPAPLSRSTAPLIQAALALLVAGSLVAFSVLAFRTGFAEDRDRDVTATDVGAAGGAVVLPAFESAAEATARRSERLDADARVAITGAADEPVVLGTRIDTSGPDNAGDDNHENQHGAGHDKGRGVGHHKDEGKGGGDDPSWEERAAREEEDESTDHSDERDDRDDDSTASGSGSQRSDGGSNRSGDGSAGRSGASN